MSQYVLLWFLNVICWSVFKVAKCTRDRDTYWRTVYFLELYKLLDLIVYLFDVMNIRFLIPFNIEFIWCVD